MTKESEQQRQMHFTVIQLSQTSQWVLQLFCYSSLKAFKYINFVYPEWIRHLFKIKSDGRFHVPSMWNLLQHKEFQPKTGKFVYDTADRRKQKYYLWLIGEASTAEGVRRQG